MSVLRLEIWKRRRTELELGPTLISRKTGHVLASPSVSNPSNGTGYPSKKSTRSEAGLPAPALRDFGYIVVGGWPQAFCLCQAQSFQRPWRVLWTSAPSPTKRHGLKLEHCPWVPDYKTKQKTGKLERKFPFCSVNSLGQRPCRNPYYSFCCSSSTWI